MKPTIEWLGRNYPAAGTAAWEIAQDDLREISEAFAILEDPATTAVDRIHILARASRLAPRLAAVLAAHHDAEVAG